MKYDFVRFYSDFRTDSRLSVYSVNQKMAMITLMLLAVDGGGKTDPSLDDEDLAFEFELSLGDWLKTKISWIQERLIHVYSDGSIEPLLWKDRENLGRPSLAEWKVLRAEIFARDNYTCQYCGDRGVALQCDHIIPVSRGGSNDWSNLTTACRACNQSKHNKTPEEWLGGAS